MSGKPYPEGVTEVVGLLDQQERLSEERIELVKHHQRLLVVNAELVDIRDKLARSMREMDLISGNTGWEARLGWFLAEMRRNNK